MNVNKNLRKLNKEKCGWSKIVLCLEGSNPVQQDPLPGKQFGGRCAGVLVNKLSRSPPSVPVTKKGNYTRGCIIKTAAGRGR